MSATLELDRLTEGSIVRCDRKSEQYKALFNGLPDEIKGFNLLVMNGHNYYVQYEYQGKRREFMIEHSAKNPLKKSYALTDEVILEARPLKGRLYEQPIMAGRWEAQVPRFAAMMIEFTCEFPHDMLSQTLYSTLLSTRDKDERRIKKYLQGLAGSFVNAVVTECESTVSIAINNRMEKIDTIEFEWQGDKLVCTHPNAPYFFYPGKRQLPHVEYLKYVHTVVECYHRDGSWKNWGNFQRKRN